MKLTKGEFKLMIKECIRELVGEGAFNQVLTESFPNSRDGSEQSHRRTEQSINPHLSNLVQQAAKMVTSARPQQADLYASLMEDTAKNTLQKMIMSEGHSSGIPKHLISEDNTPIQKSELKTLEALSVGGDMKRWAAIAMKGTK